MAKSDNMLNIGWTCKCGWSCSGINVNEVEPQVRSHDCEQNPYLEKLSEKDKTA